MSKPTQFQKWPSSLSVPYAGISSSKTAHYSSVRSILHSC
jgi:hypothetical protein